MWLFKQIWYYLGFLLRAKKPTQMHSPYLFELLPLIHDRSREYYDFQAIESIRAGLLQSQEVIPREDYGAGSRGKNQTVQQIANSALSSVDKCQMVFRLLVHEKPKTALELGTSLGIMTAYLASAHQSTQLHTLEGNTAIGTIAKDVAKSLQLTNIHFHTGRFSDILPVLLHGLPKLDFVLIDGDHRGDALKKYFEMIKPYLSEHAIVMIDDIRWSADMYVVWKEIVKDTAVRCSLDYFKFGLLFFRKDFLEKLELKVKC